MRCGEAVSRQEQVSLGQEGQDTPWEVDVVLELSWLSGIGVWVGEKPGEHCCRMGARQNLCWKIQVEFELDCTPRVRLCGKRAGPCCILSLELPAGKGRGGLLLR